jgi:hypothetical protein
MTRLVPRYDKCLSCGRAYVENQWNSGTVKCEVLLEFKGKNPKYIYVCVHFKEDILLQLYMNNNYSTYVGDRAV